MFVFFSLEGGAFAVFISFVALLVCPYVCFVSCASVYVCIYGYIYDGHVIILRYLFSLFETNIYLALYIYLLMTCNDLTKNNL